MTFQLLKYLSDNQDPLSLANTLRRKRFHFFEQLLQTLPRPLCLLDVGGTLEFWKQMRFMNDIDVSITLLNLTEEEMDFPNFKSVAGDARDLRRFTDKQFDVVFSNSVIEHLGDRNQQKQMAQEVIRVGQRYFIQTPNFYFPVEPHFLFPCFQYLPESVRTRLLQRFQLGWVNREPEFEKAFQVIRSIQLLTEREVRMLFPGCTVYHERFAGMTKSLVAYGGWGG